MQHQNGIIQSRLAVCYRCGLLLLSLPALGCDALAPSEQPSFPFSGIVAGRGPDRLEIDTAAPGARATARVSRAEAARWADAFAASAAGGGVAAIGDDPAALPPPPAAVTRAAALASHGLRARPRAVRVAGLMAGGGVGGGDDDVVWVLEADDVAPSIEARSLSNVGLSCHCDRVPVIVEACANHREHHTTVMIEAWLVAERRGGVTKRKTRCGRTANAS
jgi:hypothetical protein